MQDAMNNHDLKVAVPTTTQSDNTAVVGNIIDMAGCDALTFEILSGSLADADITITPSIDVGDDSGLSDAAALTGTGLIGTIAKATFAATDDNKVKKIGVNTSKRYARLTLTPASNTGSMTISALARLSVLRSVPAANPPA